MFTLCFYSSGNSLICLYVLFLYMKSVCICDALYQEKHMFTLCFYSSGNSLIFLYVLFLYMILLDFVKNGKTKKT